MNNTGIIILAAGNSSRFGSAKQLLHFNGKTLLQHAIDEATTSGVEHVVVITGANEKEVTESIKNKTVEIFYNETWQQGMASGIVLGMHKIITLNNDIEKVVITVCDQPFISASLFQQLYEKQNTSTEHIIASAYADTIGTPALFTQKYFDALMGLKGDEGAKKILLANKNDVASIDFPQGNIDIDTQKDYEELVDRQKHVL